MDGKIKEMKEALLYKKLDNKKVQCQNCSHYCIIKPDRKGICGVRKNIDRELYSLAYGKPCTVHIDPIEKKPLFHFLPGSNSLSIATVGCQFSCKNCQNWQISQAPKEKDEIEGKEISPQEIVDLALKNNLPSISYTYTDPIVFSEYALDIMKLAHKNGIKNVWVSSGFWSEELFEIISPYLDAANIDLKGFSEEFYKEVCGGKLKPVLKNLKETKEKGIWLEVTTLIIPTLNDSKETFKNIAEFIEEELGAETPWHISKFSGALSWKLKDLSSTPIETLEKAYEIGKEAGLKYVYLGNVPQIKDKEDTFCSQCDSLMIDRTGYNIKRYDKEGKCDQCGANLNLILK